MKQFRVVIDWIANYFDKRNKCCPSWCPNNKDDYKLIEVIKEDSAYWKTIKRCGIKCNKCGNNLIAWVL